MLRRRSPAHSLRKRAQFLALRDAPNWSVPAALVAGARRPVPDGQPSGPARVGFTVTKKLGNAVVRNRIRRRLREAVRLLGEDALRDGFDYVLIARTAALKQPFDALTVDLASAVDQINSGRARRAGERHPRRKGGGRAPAQRGSPSVARPTRP